MRLIRGIDRWQENTDSVVTIGNFDGVHLGHQAMLKQLVDAAKQHSMLSCVVSFEPLPHEYFANDVTPARLHGFRDRVQSIAALGIDRLLLLRFDQAQANESADDFISRILVNKLQARHVLVGDDFRFGHKRTGDFAKLQARAASNGFTAAQYETISIDGERVSSTRIRKHLAADELDWAAKLLGQSYSISGRVVHGEKVGRQLGFPTANIALGKHRPPLRGVFAVVVHDQNTERSYAAVANLGERPTVNGRRLLLEVHALNTDAELYGHHLKVEFIEYIRSEVKFESLDELKNAISNDADTASRILNSNPQLKYLCNRNKLTN